MQANRDLQGETNPAESSWLRVSLRIPATDRTRRTVAVDDVLATAGREGWLGLMEAPRSDGEGVSVVLDCFVARGRVCVLDAAGRSVPGPTPVEVEASLRAQLGPDAVVSSSLVTDLPAHLLSGVLEGQRPGAVQGLSASATASSPVAMAGTLYQDAFVSAGPTTLSRLDALRSERASLVTLDGGSDALLVYRATAGAPEVYLHVGARPRELPATATLGGADDGRRDSAGWRGDTPWFPASSRSALREAIGAARADDVAETLDALPVAPLNSEGQAARDWVGPASEIAVMLGFDPRYIGVLAGTEDAPDGTKVEAFVAPAGAQDPFSDEASAVAAPRASDAGDARAENAAPLRRVRERKEEPPKRSPQTMFFLAIAEVVFAIALVAWRPVPWVWVNWVVAAVLLVDAAVSLVRWRRESLKDRHAERGPKRP